MTAEALIDTLRDAGVRLTTIGHKLRVEAPQGAYTPDQRAQLVEHKAEVMGLLAMRDRLRGVAETVGVPAMIVDGLPASELRACIDQLPLWDGQYDQQGEPLQTRVLVFYLRALADLEPAVAGSPVDQRRRRAAGEAGKPRT